MARAIYTVILCGFFSSPNTQKSVFLEYDCCKETIVEIKLFLTLSLFTAKANVVCPVVLFEYLISMAQNDYIDPKSLIIISWLQLYKRNGGCVVRQASLIAAEKERTRHSFIIRNINGKYFKQLYFLNISILACLNNECDHRITTFCLTGLIHRSLRLWFAGSTPKSYKTGLCLFCALWARGLNVVFLQCIFTQIKYLKNSFCQILF